MVHWFLFLILDGEKGEKNNRAIFSKIDSCLTHNIKNKIICLYNFLKFFICIFLYQMVTLRIWEKGNLISLQPSLISVGFYKKVAERQSLWFHGNLVITREKYGYFSILLIFETAKLDSCNSLLYGLPQHLISRWQSIQNTAARVVTRTRKFDHITPVLKQLHWLPVRYRIVFKILLLVYKALNETAPSYISELLKYHTSERKLRSYSQHLLATRKLD